MILVDIIKEQVCLMYRSTRVYDYDTTPTTLETKVLLMLTEDGKKFQEHFGWVNEVKKEKIQQQSRIYN
jgi:hypothetical protein